MIERPADGTEAQSPPPGRPGPASCTTRAAPTRTAHVRTRQLAQGSAGRCPVGRALAGHGTAVGPAQHARGAAGAARHAVRPGRAADAEKPCRAVRHRHARATALSRAHRAIRRPRRPQREDRAADLGGDLRPHADVPERIRRIRARRVRRAGQRQVAGRDPRARLPPDRPSRPRRAGAALPLRVVDPRQMGGGAFADRARDVAADRAAARHHRARPPADDDRAPVPDDPRPAADRRRQSHRGADRAGVGGARHLVRIAAPVAVGAHADVVLRRPHEPRRPQAPDVGTARRQRAVRRHPAAARHADAKPGRAAADRARQAALRRIEARRRAAHATRPLRRQGRSRIQAVRALRRAHADEGQRRRHRGARQDRRFPARGGPRSQFRDVRRQDLRRRARARGVRPRA